MTRDQDRSLLFLMTGEGEGGSARVYSHDWLERRKTGFYSETEGGRTVVRLIIHQVEPRLSGHLECHVTMQLTDKEPPVLVPAFRSQRITVVERPELEAEVRLVEAGSGVQCEAPGYPAPHISWHHLEPSHQLSPVSDDKVETLPLEVQSETGLQVSREKLYRVEEGEFVCLVAGREGEEAHRLSVWANLSWEHTGILEQPDQSVQSDLLQPQSHGNLHHQHQELIIALTSLSIILALILLIACCLCSWSCRRRSNSQIYYQNHRTLGRQISSQ